MKLYHFSDKADINKFEPRRIYEDTEATVWTIGVVSNSRAVRLILKE